LCKIVTDGDLHVRRSSSLKGKQELDCLLVVDKAGYPLFVARDLLSKTLRRLKCPNIRPGFSKESGIRYG
jgi:hypothetical protein